MYDFFPSYSLTIMSTSDSNCLYLSPLFLFTSFHPFSSPCIPPLLLNTLFYDFVIHPIVNFINVKRTNFLYERMFWQLLLHICRAAKMTFVRKTRAFYVDEIDTYSQFRQHLITSFLPIYAVYKIRKIFGEFTPVLS